MQENRRRREADVWPDPGFALPLFVRKLPRAWRMAHCASTPCSVDRRIYQLVTNCRAKTGRHIAPHRRAPRRLDAALTLHLRHPPCPRRGVEARSRGPARPHRPAERAGLLRHQIGYRRSARSGARGLARLDRSSVPRPARPRRIRSRARRHSREPNRRATAPPALFGRSARAATMASAALRPRSPVTLASRSSHGWTRGTTSCSSSCSRSENEEKRPASMAASSRCSTRRS